MPVMPGYANADTPHTKTVHLASQGWRYGPESWVDNPLVWVIEFKKLEQR